MKPNEAFSLFFAQEIANNCDMLADRVEAYGMTHDSYAQSMLFRDMLTMPKILPFGSLFH